MRNRYPVWINVLILTVLAFGIIYSLPNFYGEDPSVQLSPSRNAKIDDRHHGFRSKTCSKEWFEVKAGRVE